MPGIKTQPKHAKCRKEDAPSLAEPLSSQQSGEDHGHPAGADAPFRPALFANYRNLSRLRYDFPLVLTQNKAREAAVRSLSSLVDGVLQEIAPPGTEGEQFRSHVLLLEEEIRLLASRGAKRPLSVLWDLAADNLVNAATGSAQDSMRDDLDRARSALTLDGDVIDCDAQTPVEVVTHLWRGTEERKARQFKKRVDRLIHGLSNLLQVDFMNSPAGWTPEQLQHSVGGSYAEAFDFEALGDVIKTVACRNALPEIRKQRVTDTIAVLKSQRFFALAPSSDPQSGRDAVHRFVFEQCEDALQAFENRREEMAAVVRAIGIATLELENRYRESVHDAALAQVDGNALKPEDVAQFPSYLVCVRNMAEANEAAHILETAASGLPMKLLVISDDILADLSVTAGPPSLESQASRLASMVMGLEDVFVLQTSSSHLNRMSDGVARGLEYDGAALFTVFSGCGEGTSAFPPYLVAAAALESRAFPAFTYDPAAGDDWAVRFNIECNPQCERTWPIHEIHYEDEEHQRSSEQVSFAFPEFATCDRRFRQCFKGVPRSDWNETMLPAGDHSDLSNEARTGRTPYVLVVDGKDRLGRHVVDDVVMRAARKCARRWRSLQELGGINNSHAQRLLALEKTQWEEKRQAELKDLNRVSPAVPDDSITAKPELPSDVAPAAPPAAIKPPADEAFIETPRCTTCEECIKINKRMFAYNENKQAYIADPDAGPYRDLVRAAENCQVCIIHPGKPRNPDEVDLKELLKRAEPFR